MPDVLKNLLKRALVLGIFSGALEVFLHAESRLGLSVADRMNWLFVAILFGCLVTLSAACFAAFLHLRWGVSWGGGLIVSALLALHGALYFRFEYVLNEPVLSPKVWGPLLLILAFSLVIGWRVNRYIERGLRVQWGIAFLAVIGFFWKSQPAGSLASTDQVNVLLVTFDTTRADRLGAYGGNADTPTIDALARAGVLYEQAIAPAPLTQASHLSLLTGKALHRTGIYSNGTRLGDRPAMISHAFQDAGYRTGAVVSGFPLHGKYGWTQGFDFYEDDFGARPGLHRLSLMRAWDQLTLPGNTIRERPGRQTLSRAKSFLKRHGKGPFFLWVHFFDPHAPYEVSEKELAEAPRDGAPLNLPRYWPPAHRSITSTDWLIEAYEKEISATDALLGELLDALPEGVREKTVVAFTADHGESLTEHDYLFDHGDYLYDASLHIPLILAGPGVPENKRIACQVSGIDLSPTLRGLAGIGALDFEPGMGETLAPFDEQCEDRIAHAAAVAERYVANPPIDHALRMVLDYGGEQGKRMSKFIQHEKRENTLFDLVSDPGETQNLNPAASGVAQTAEGVLDVMLEGAADVVMPQSDPTTTDALKALGYIE